MMVLKQISDAGNSGMTNRTRILIFSEEVKASLKSKEKTRVLKLLRSNTRQNLPIEL